MIIHVREIRGNFTLVLASHFVAILRSEVDSVITDGRFNPGVVLCCNNYLAIFLSDVISATSDFLNCVTNRERLHWTKSS